MLALRKDQDGELYPQSTRARLLSSTLVSPVVFGYQCFIFINREFSNIAYYIHIYIYMHTTYVSR